MNSNFIYTVSRFSVSTEDEVLVEQAELVDENGILILRVDGTPDRHLAAEDVSDAIAAEPVLSEIRANQITRIKAGGVALDFLPFGLSVPGDPDDFDETLWSKSQATQHTHQNWVVQPGRCRVAYINESRWCPWPTADGPRMLPEHWPTVDLSPTWVRLTFSETASMTSGQDEITLGLVTPRVAAACFHPDSDSLQVSLWRRTGDPTVDARIITEWLLDWITETYGVTDDDFKVLLAQLFGDAGWRGKNGSELVGSQLAAGWGTSLDFGDTDTSEWCLKLSLPEAAKSLALDLIAQRDGRLAAITTATRQPESPEGKSRLAALADWESDRQAIPESGNDELQHDEYRGDGYADEDYDEDDEYARDLSAPWNHSPISRMPAVITPGEIAIQLWRRYARRGRPVGSDFVFTWNGSREAEWRYGISPDNPEKPALSTRWNASFRGTAAWPDGVNVQLSYASDDLGLKGKATLDAAAPTMMDPGSDERMKRPGLWVDLGGKIIQFLDGLPG